MIIDMQQAPPSNVLVGGANVLETFSRNAAAFNIVDIYKEVITFGLKIAQCVTFSLRGR